MKYWLSVILVTMSFWVSAQQPLTVVVTYPNTQLEEIKLSYNQPVRLDRVLTDATKTLTKEQFKHIHWTGARLGSQKLSQVFDKKKQLVDQQLADLAQYWRVRAEHRVANNITTVRQRLNRLTFFPSYFMGIEADRTKLILQQNPLLASSEGGQFYLRLPVGYTNNNVALLSKAEQNFGYAIAVNGDIAQVPTAIYNRTRPSICYVHQPENPIDNQNTGLCELSATVTLIYLLPENYLPEAYTALNISIAELLKFTVGTSE